MAERILLIEDDSRLAGMLSTYLGENGLDVEWCADATSGISTARSAHFDALILDVMLPDGDGFDVCRRLRADSDLPIIMLTARGDPTDRIVGLEIGADDYVPKPFEPRELLARLRAVLRRGRHEPKGDTGRMRFGRLEIDVDARAASVDGQVVDITAYQFELLRILAENAGRVLSRDALMDGLRGQELTAFDRSIDVHVSRIRAAIEDEPKRPKRIVTVRGFGYVFTRSQD